eukprot:CAMPEP_0117558432 /NCGR_PEP_ID=MMETSP0784-20121206/52833_1 /TAXON_ID=39447 /ORGANISM="" /LENGTH=151 /DNA_ID=CAMNT_0005355761 /DNA_START=61 /DNA_END=516 /DNA_ORIENTATION=+
MAAKFRAACAFALLAVQLPVSQAAGPGPAGATDGRHAAASPPETTGRSSTASLRGAARGPRPVDAGSCICDWIPYDDCQDTNNCAQACRQANPWGPCAQHAEPENCATYECTGCNDSVCMSLYGPLARYYAQRPPRPEICFVEVSNCIPPP